MTNKKNNRGYSSSAYGRTSGKSTARSSGGAIKGGGVLTVVVAIILVAVILALYYFNIPPLDFDLGFGFKRSSSLRPERLSIHFIDVGQGDCIFIELPDGKNMIIDGGDGTKKNNSAVMSYIRALNVTEIDYCILTHSDNDHAGGLVEVISSDIYVKKAYIPYVASTHSNDIVTNYKEIIPDSLDGIEPLTVTTNVYRDFIGAIIAEGLLENASENITVNFKGLTIEGDYYSFTFLSPNANIYSKKKDTAEYKNSVSPFIMLKYNDKKVLFTGDANEVSEKELLKDVNSYEYSSVDTLKVGHHGSRTSSTAEFLSVVRPKYAIISSSKAGNNYDHPHQETLDRLMGISCVVYRTDLRGSILLQIDDDGMNFIFANSMQSSLPIIASLIIARGALAFSMQGGYAL